MRTHHGGAQNSATAIRMHPSGPRITRHFDALHQPGNAARRLDSEPDMAAFEHNDSSSKLGRDGRKAYLQCLDGAGSDLFENESPDPVSADL